jgi:hypothetical protein
MNCRLKYADDISKTVKELFEVGKTSARLLKPNQILLPIGGKDFNNKSLKTKENTNAWAKRIKKTADKEFEADKFGTVVHIDNNSHPNGTIVNILIHKGILDAYERKYGSQTEMFQMSPAVSYMLKAANILSSQKAIDWFKKRDKGQLKGDQFWTKLQQDLQIPKEQIEILKGLDTKNPYNREELLTSLLASYSYTVEVNTSQFKKGLRKSIPGSLGSKFTEEEHTGNTHYYSNLTVPGGTNYTENEIKTPAITPSIKGHAQFSTDNGIGWFRSDEQSIDDKYKFISIRKSENNWNKDKWLVEYEESPKKLNQDRVYTITKVKEFNTREEAEEFSKKSTKTRRILEVQSDLFQKGRDRKDLSTTLDINKANLESIDDYYRGIDFALEKGNVTQEEAEALREHVRKTKEDSLKTPANNFLQLLNKDNNWITFFTKSIIQDSAKKGYEKVLFPKGDTASKIEGHSTLEELKQSISNEIHAAQARLREIGTWEVDKAEGSETWDVIGEQGIIEQFKTKELAEKKISDRLRANRQQIDHKEEELNRIETEGFATLRPIYKFYEETVANILKKQGYNPTIITDEYGNKWYEIEIKPEYAGNTILLQQQPNSNESEQELKAKIEAKLIDYAKINNIPIDYVQTLFDKHPSDPTAVFDMVTGAIKINQNKAGIDTLAEELVHHAHLALGDDYVPIKRAMNLVARYGIENVLGDEYEAYKQLYKGNEEMLKREAVDKLATKALVNRLARPKEFENSDGTGVKLWDTITRIIDAIIRLFKPNHNIMSELQKNVDKLAQIVAEGRKTGDNIKPESDMYQLSKEADVIPESYRKQYVHYKQELKKAKNDLAKEEKRISSLKGEELSNSIAKIKRLEEYTSKVQTALNDVRDTGNKQVLINLAEETLERIEKFITKANEQGLSSLNTEENIDRMRTTLQVFVDWKPTMVKAKELLGEKIDPEGDKPARYTGLRALIRKYALEQIKAATGKDFTEEEYDELGKDVISIEKWLGSPMAVNDYLTKTIAILIKKAQKKITEENQKSTELVKEHTEALQKYAKDNGKSLKDIYKLFIQDIGNTTILTTRYTSEFSKLISDSYKMDYEAGLKLRKSIAKWNPVAEEWEPREDKHYNKNYNTIRNNKVLSDFYDFFKSTIEDISNELPVTLRRNFIPNIAENSLLHVLGSDGTYMNKLKEGVQNIVGIYDLPDINDSFILDQELFKDQVPLRYIAPLSSKDKSGDLGDSLLRFMYFVNSYKEMSEILPKTKLLQEEIANKRYRKQGTNPNISVTGESTNIHKMVEDVINMQVKGQMKADETWGKVQWGKYIDFGLKYNSLLRIGLNPFNALSNVFIGTIGNYIEATGGRYYTVGELTKATKIYTTEAWDIDSKTQALIKLFNPLMELEDYENLKTVGMSYLSSKKFQDKAKSFMYWPQRQGENLLQSTTMIAHLMHTKTTDKNGNKLSLWEAFGKDGKWDTERMGREFTEDEVFNITNRIQRINQMIHGRYSQRDAATAQQFALFRMFFQFRKWIPAAFEARFMSKRTDDVLGKDIEGRYRTLFRLGTINSLKLSLEAMKSFISNNESKQFTEMEIYNMRKNLVEITIMLTIMASAWLLGGAGDDDKELKKQGWFKFSMMQLERTSGDLSFFYSPDEFNHSLLRSGAPLGKTVDDLFRVVWSFDDLFQLSEHPEYVSGYRKGENRFWAALADITPVVKPAVDVYRTTKKDVPYVSMFK